ncbi:hypothetical protein AAFF_G00374490 [Aldrovandia affinis]|uniref:Uncharacterized protein n=1 Tax=Aldrovandia affinis TaxID=143900 RepID=A0AAD7SGD2_9TELE|nr:hypothetical protein AAFF_G00374490 [Aldrovandia affinis]
MEYDFSAESVDSVKLPISDFFLLKEKNNLHFFRHESHKEVFKAKGNGSEECSELSTELQSRRILLSLFSTVGTASDNEDEDGTQMDSSRQTSSIDLLLWNYLK